MKHLVDKIFAGIEAGCLMAGGDGDFMVITPNFINAANNFEKFLIENNNNYWKRANSDTHITFYGEQEGLYFSDTEIDVNTDFTFIDRFAWLG